MADPPSGTVTFLFTDIEGSTRLWEQHPAAMSAARARHDELLRDTIESHGGSVFKTVGDQICAAFTTAYEALAAALAAQRALEAEPWGEIESLRVRMAVHTGAAEERGGDYFGLALSRVARLLKAGHGGQILLSQATAELVGNALPVQASMRNLGVHRLRDLARSETIVQLTHPELPADFPPLRSLEAFTHNLPVQLTSFIGREEEIAAVKRLLEATHLLTLTGAGGCGKTRLALQVAVELLDAFPDGVWLIELASLADPGLVPQTAASTLGVKEEPGRAILATLLDYLRGKRLLLLLDNCEHLLAACAQLADTLLRSCPDVRILATGREAMGLAGERSHPVPPLSAPDLQPLPAAADLPARLMRYEAVQLFAERALLSQPGFGITPENGPAVAQVCRRLDGIPLAIELAAARVRALPVEAINERLDEMFRLLTGGSRTALPRHQTLRALIDWSYDLLTDAEQALLRRLSVFAGGCTLEAAEAVCSGVQAFGRSGVPDPTDESDHSDAGPERPNARTPERLTFLLPEDVLDLLTSLVDKSLVLYEERRGEARYRLLETVRQYARDRLLEAGEAEVVRGQHRNWFLALAEQAEPELRGPEQVVWLNRLETEHDNLRSALDWCQGAEDRALAELRLAGALQLFWARRSYCAEGQQRIHAALVRSSVAPASLRIPALHGAWSAAYVQGDYASANASGEESLALARQVDAKGHIVHSLVLLGFVAMGMGDYERAAALAEESLALVPQVEDPWEGIRPFLLNGIVARARGDYERAAYYLTEGLALAREVGDIWHIGYLLTNLGEVALHQEDSPRARRLFSEGLRQFREMDHRRGIAWCLSGLAAVAAAECQARQAAELLGAVDGLLAAIGQAIPPPMRANHARSVALARAGLGEDAFAAARKEGRALTLEQAVAYALECRDAPSAEGDEPLP